jgi:hypothetical protein
MGVRAPLDKRAHADMGYIEFVAAHNGPGAKTVGERFLKVARTVIVKHLPPRYALSTILPMAELNMSLPAPNRWPGPSRADNAWFRIDRIKATFAAKWIVRARKEERAERLGF